MAPEHRATTTETRVGLKDGGEAVLTLADVAVAALDTPEDQKYDVLVAVGGRNLPALTLVRNALGGREPGNTNAAETALRKLGFSVLVRRRFDDSTGEPIRLSREQIARSST
ncbi:hypothetical protein [Streptomyces sp. MI02-7b]|uniref:hypothetical protein n=1 Tax=Streptomyces sp. MI02-7b TaxID=462941 RepID=UPI0029A2EB5C|nr:hypothetical protein [Streptomyces sp. MI02-7b]MDX3075550.1 hypothetical protein [Streptomyces sp. MI02-7b]